MDRIYTVLNISAKASRRVSWSGERLAKMETTSRPDHLQPEIWSKMSKAAQRKEKQEWASEQPKLDNARRFRGIHFIDLGDAESLIWF